MKHISKEEELFNWLKEKVYSDLVWSRNQMSRWDCYSPKKKHRIELKCRRKHYDSLLVERPKYDAMLAECAKHNDIPVYINSTPEGVFIFDMRTHNGIWELRSMPKTTDFKQRHFVTKEVGYFYTEEAYFILLKDC